MVVLVVVVVVVVVFFFFFFERVDYICTENSLFCMWFPKGGTPLFRLDRYGHGFRVLDRNPLRECEGWI